MAFHKHTQIVGLLALGIVLSAIPDLVQAQGVASGGSLADAVVDNAAYLAMLNVFMHILLMTILKMLGYLMQADIFNDPQMMSALNTVWRLSRDIMNVLFALALIVVAFYTILTAKAEFIKQKYVHFILAVILVNFSWFFPRVIIDFANVLTATVYSIPNTLPDFTCYQISDVGAPKKPCEVVMDAAFLIDPVQQDAFCQQYGFTPGTDNCSCFGMGCYAKDTWVNARTKMRPAHAMINGLAVSFAKITNYALIPQTIASAGRGNVIDPGKVTLQIVLGVIMAFLVQLAIILPLLGIGIGLFLRILIMWVCVAFMPFTFLGLLVNGKPGTNVFGLEDYVWKEFLAAAFLPAMVAVPITIGFIMLGTAASVPVPPNAFGLNTFSIPLIPHIQGWWPMMWIFAAIAIMWVGSFTALRKSQLVGKVTDKLQGFGQQAFKSATKLPLLTPIPFPGGGGTTVGSLLNIKKDFTNAMNTTTEAGGGFPELFSNLQKRRSGGGGFMLPNMADSAEMIRLMKNNKDLQQGIKDKLDGVRLALTGNSTKTNLNDQFTILRDRGVMSGVTDNTEFSRQLLAMGSNNDVPQEIKDIINQLKPQIERISKLP